MGLRITRLERKSPQRPEGSNLSISTVWSARDLCRPDMLSAPPATVLERVPVDGQAHLSAADTKRLFDRLWTELRGQVGAIVELDMTDVQTVDPRFYRELEFFRQQIQRQVGDIRVRNFD